MVACDVYRPAAIDQLEALGRELDIPVYRGEGADPVAIAQAGVKAGRRDRCATSSSSTPPAGCTSTRR